MKARALVALVTGAVLIGFVPLGVRLSELPPLATGFWRFALAIPLLALLARGGGPAGALRPGLLVAAGLAFAADIGCFFLSIAATTTANATLLSNAAPVVVLAGAFLLWRERPRPIALVGTALAVAGVGLLLGEGVRIGGGRLVGDVLGLVSALFYGIYQLVVARLRRDQPALRVMLWIACVGAVALGAWAALSGEPLLPVTARGWLVLVGLALVTQVGGQGLITWALAHLPATFSCVVLLIQPLVAAVIGVLVLHDPLTPWLLAGGLLILTGILLAARR
jgi:drug/metabolite transporter (DMT)-like permease